MRYVTLLFVVTALLLGGCGADIPTETDAPAATTPPEWPSAADRTMEPGMAPTPFSAQQIRDGCWAGRAVTWRIEQQGREPRIQTFHFVGGTPESCEFTVVAKSVGGEVLEETPILERAWDELQKHASYPLEDTEITEVTLETATGTQDCFLYTVTTKTDVATSVTKYWFSKAHPGPPLQIVTTVDGEETSRQTLVSDEETAVDDTDEK